MNCANCGKELEIKKKPKKFCGLKCKNAYHNRTSARIVVPGNKKIIEEHVAGILENRSVIKDLLKKGIKNTTFSELVMSGLHPFFFSKKSTVEQITTYYCFEYYFFRYGDSNAVELGIMSSQDKQS